MRWWGGEVERAAEIVGHARHDLMNRDQWHRLARWLKLFSHEAVQQYPHLILLRCWLDLYHWYRLDYLVKDLDLADFQLETSALNAPKGGGESNRAGNSQGMMPGSGRQIPGAGC